MEDNSSWGEGKGNGFAMTEAHYSYYALFLYIITLYYNNILE